MRYRMVLVARLPTGRIIRQCIVMSGRLTAGRTRRKKRVVDTLRVVDTRKKRVVDTLRIEGVDNVLYTYEIT